MTFAYIDESGSTEEGDVFVMGDHPALRPHHQHGLRDKSQHSSLVQVADAVSYVYRRNLELTTQAKPYAGEQAFYAGVAMLDPKRERRGRTPDAECIRFYDAVKHPAWAL